MNTKTIAGMVAVVVLVGGVSFYGGMQYGKGADRQGNIGNFPGQPGQFGRGMGGGGMRGGRAGNGPTAGEIIAKDASTLTIKALDGSSRIVFYSAQTTTTKSVAGSLSDLTIGQQISVIGTANSDGSVTAQTIQIRPVGFRSALGNSSSTGR